MAKHGTRKGNGDQGKPPFFEREIPSGAVLLGSGPQRQQLPPTLTEVTFSGCQCIIQPLVEDDTVLGYRIVILDKHNMHAYYYAFGEEAKDGFMQTLADLPAIGSKVGESPVQQ
jgi:hypothetical protein